MVCRKPPTSSFARAQGRLRPFPPERVLGPAFTPGASSENSAPLCVERPVPRAFSLKWLEPSANLAIAATSPGFSSRVRQLPVWVATVSGWPKGVSARRPVERAWRS